MGKTKLLKMRKTEHYSGHRTGLSDRRSRAVLGLDSVTRGSEEDAKTSGRPVSKEEDSF